MFAAILLGALLSQSHPAWDGRGWGVAATDAFWILRDGNAAQISVSLSCPRISGGDRGFELQAIAPGRQPVAALSFYADASEELGRVALRRDRQSPFYRARLGDDAAFMRVIGYLKSMTLSGSMRLIGTQSRLIEAGPNNIDTIDLFVDLCRHPHTLPPGYVAP